ncbi:hypothetical protein DIPPA_20583 [Diplonema papillatum]|nr:hypothetical protein DIPPA_20583 [Diplonema papillatum]
MEWVADTALCLFEKGEIDSAEFNARLATEALAQAAETALSTSGFGTDNSGLQKQLTISTESSALQKQDSSFLMAGVLQSYDSLNSPTVSIESVPTNIQSTSSFLYPAAQQENQLLPPTCGSPRTPCSISSASSTNSLPLKCILRSPPPPPAHGALQAEGTAWTAAAPPPPAAPPAAAPAPRRRKKSLHPGSPRVAAAKYNPDDDDDDDADDDEADSADSASDCKKARERPPEKEKKSAFSRLFCCFGGARQVKAGAPAPAGPAPAEEDEEGLQKVTSLLARSKQPYVPPGHAKRVSIALSRRSRKVSFNEHSSAVPSPWKQVLMLRVEIAFFRGDDDLVTCLDDAEDAGCDVSGVKEGLAIMNGCFLKETSSIRVLRNSPLAIMAVAAHAEALGAITIDEDDLIVREPLDLNPIPTTSTGMPNRPSLRLGYLSVRAIVRLFCGDAKGVYDDCVLLKDSSVSDPRTLLYATLLRSYANLWYSETAFPDDEAWKALREADLSQAVADARHISDRFLQMLGATRADLSSKRGEKAEALVRRGAGLVTPYHALACVAVLDKLKKHEGLRPQAERLLELLDTVSTSFPFARPAFLYYRGVIVGGGTRDFLSCLEICSENEWFASPFAFCAAVRLLSPQGTSSNVLVSIFLAQLSERSESPPDSDQVPAVRLAVLAKQAHLHPPEYSILKSMLSNEKSRKA